MLNRKKYLPKIKLWDGTTSHASVDTLMMQECMLKLKELGFEAEHKGLWSFEDLQNGKVAYVTHTRRLGGLNPYSISQRDSEKFMIDMFKGMLPRNLCMQIAAHGHTIRGSIDDEPFRIINCPCFVSFMEYLDAQANFAHYQTDIGAYFIIVTKEGRIRTQPWIYPPFVYNHNEKRIYSGVGEHSNGHKYVDMSGKTVIESYFKDLCKDAKFIIAIIADLHVGHIAAVSPEKYEYKGQEFDVALSPANKLLLSYWKNFVVVCKEIKPHEIWMVGDGCNGVQRNYDRAQRALTQNLEEQKAMLVELFKEFL